MSSRLLSSVLLILSLSGIEGRDTLIPKPAVVGGSPAIAKEFSHAARLGNRNAENKTNWFCGGTLISDRLVLTAAHCFYSELGAVNVVRLGELEFDNDMDDAEPEDFDVLSTTSHPDFSNPILYNDIGIVRLTRDVTYSPYKYPACLPFKDGESLGTFIAIGWGARQFSQSQSKELYKVELQGYGDRCFSSVEPNEELPYGYNPSTQLCVGSPEHKDTCNGDSGGPVLTYSRNTPCRSHIVGITSTGVACDTPDYPSVYTRVHYYMNWIKQQLRSSTPDKLYFFD